MRKSTFKTAVSKVITEVIKEEVEALYQQYGEDVPCNWVNRLYFNFDFNSDYIIDTFGVALPEFSNLDENSKQRFYNVVAIAICNAEIDMHLNNFGHLLNIT